LIFKRLFDFFSALSGLLVFGVVIVVSVILATIDTKSFGLFIQKRIGQHGKPLQIFKIKTLNDKTRASSRFGNFLRNSKLDELPQLFNILNGTMSFVGPRPDVSGYADTLIGADKIILNVRPGVTGIASLKYRKEEQLLTQQPNPLYYNDTVIWPAKVRINKWYVQNHTFLLDLKILFYTMIPSSFDAANLMRSNTISK
jgi:lipopolysaccharide/colanic/teichoic acid biosynthesis glycosyltransferase